MNFTKVIGKIDSSLVNKAEKKLSKVFLELGMSYDNRFYGNNFGGDPLVFSLIYPVDHICTLNIPTAATDGKRYYWNPKFVLKLSEIGLRLVCSHEAFHALYLHPERRGSRLPILWNISVDFVVNNIILEDLSVRNLSSNNRYQNKSFTDIFKTHLGKYITLEEYAQFLRDPFNPPAIFKNSLPNDNNIKLPHPGEERTLTDKEIEEINRRENEESVFFADPSLSEDMKRPEKIYDYLYNILPKCSTCGSIGVYNKSKKSDKDKSNSNNKSSKNDKSDDNNCCPECGEGFDIFSYGSTLDEHMDTEEDKDKLSKRIYDAIEATKRMVGKIPSQLEEELGLLTKPKIVWQDIIRSKLSRIKLGHGRNDWTRFRTKPLFSGLLVPRRRNYDAKFICLLDTSGSMSKDNIAYGLSQLLSLDRNSEGVVVPADAKIYWDNAVELKTISEKEIKNIKIIGRGGTKYSEFFSQYEQKIGKFDFIIVITDGYLSEYDLLDMKKPSVDTIWLITSVDKFNPPFGKAYNLSD